MQSRIEDILQAIVDGSGSEDFPAPQSRTEALLLLILDAIDSRSGGSAIELHICSSDEYDHNTGIPTIQNPSSSVFYLVPAGISGNDLYEEWIWTGESWEKIRVAQAGPAGKGIVSINKTGTSGLVDTYTITFTDNTTATFTVTNGAVSIGYQNNGLVIQNETR